MAQDYTDKPLPKESYSEYMDRRNNLERREANIPESSRLRFWKPGTRYKLNEEQSRAISE